MFNYFDNIIKLEDLDIDDILKDENYVKVFWFMIFHIKLCVLDSIK